MAPVEDQPHHWNRSNDQRKEDMAKRKKKFLDSFEACGTIRGACNIVGVGRPTYHRWVVEDADFAKEFDQRRVAFAESLEELALDRVRNPDKNRGSDLLLIGLLNANMPSKYRPQVAMSEDSAKDLIIEWRKASREVVKAASSEKPEEDLAPNISDTLTEILARRGNAPKETEEPEGDK